MREVIQACVAAKLHTCVCLKPPKLRGVGSSLVIIAMTYILVFRLAKPCVPKQWVLAINRFEATKKPLEATRFLVYATNIIIPTPVIPTLRLFSTGLGYVSSHW